MKVPFQRASPVKKQGAYRSQLPTAKAPRRAQPQKQQQQKKVHKQLVGDKGPRHVMDYINEAANDGR